MLGADVMKVGGHWGCAPVTQLKVKQLAEELSECGATKSGRKRAMQLRLRALIIAAASDAVES